MIFSLKPSIVTAVLGLLVTFGLVSNDAFARERGRRHMGPPPEAYTACEGKSAGDTAEFESPRGDTVTGTCEQAGDRLVLRPDRPPRGGRSDSADN